MADASTPEPFETTTYTARASGVAAHISSPSGSERAGSDGGERIDAVLLCDTTVARNDRVTDELTGDRVPGGVGPRPHRVGPRTTRRRASCAPPGRWRHERGGHQRVHWSSSSSPPTARWPRTSMRRALQVDRMPPSALPGRHPDSAPPSRGRWRPTATAPRGGRLECRLRPHHRAGRGHRPPRLGRQLRHRRTRQRAGRRWRSRTSSRRWRRPSDHLRRRRRHLRPCHRPAARLAPRARRPRRPSWHRHQRHRAGVRRRVPRRRRPPSAPAISLYTAGGLDGGTLLDRPFARFNVWALRRRGRAGRLRAPLRSRTRRRGSPRPGRQTHRMCGS
jgi:hypothetical protein